MKMGTRLERLRHYLTCCCDSRKKTQPQSDVVVTENPASGAESSPPEIEANREKFQEEFRKAVDNQVSLIATQLVKKSGLACTLNLVRDQQPSSAIIAKIDAALNDCMAHPQFEDLKNVVRGGPTDENRALAEKLSDLIAQSIVSSVVQDSSHEVVEVIEAPSAQNFHMLTQKTPSEENVRMSSPIASPSARVSVSGSVVAGVDPADESD